jgi:hypothetical protein
MALVFQTHVAQLQLEGEQHRILELQSPIDLTTSPVHQFVETLIHNQISNIYLYYKHFQFITNNRYMYQFQYNKH